MNDARSVGGKGDSMSVEVSWLGGGGYWEMGERRTAPGFQGAECAGFWFFVCHGRWWRVLSGTLTFFFID